MFNLREVNTNYYLKIIKTIILNQHAHISRPSNKIKIMD
jgi:hypothetical protein